MAMPQPGKWNYESCVSEDALYIYSDYYGTDPQDHATFLKCGM